MRVQESYIDTFIAQVAGPGLFGGFSFHGLKNQKVVDSRVRPTAQRKEHNKKGIEKDRVLGKVRRIKDFFREQI